MATRNQKTQTDNNEVKTTRPGRKPGSKATVKVEVNPVTEEVTDVNETADDAGENDNNEYVVKNADPNMSILSCPLSPCNYYSDSIVGPDSYLVPMQFKNGDARRFKSNYFKAIATKATEIVVTLSKNCMYVGSTRMSSLILSEEGQFVLFSNEDRCVKSNEITLNAYLPYIHNGKVCVVEYGSTSIESPEMVRTNIKNNTRLRTPFDARNQQQPQPVYQPVALGQLPMSPYAHYGMPQYELPYLVKENLTFHDYLNGLTRDYSYSDRKKKYRPVCMWNLELGFNNDLLKYDKIMPVNWIMPEVSALEILKGKAMPLVFAGSVPDTDMGMEATL